MNGFFHVPQIAYPVVGCITTLLISIIIYSIQGNAHNNKLFINLYFLLLYVA